MPKGLGDGEQAGRSSFPGGCGAERRAEDRQSSQLLQTQHPWRWSSVIATWE